MWQYQDDEALKLSARTPYTYTIHAHYIKTLLAVERLFLESVSNSFAHFEAMIPVHQLKQCPARRQVYFGLPQHGTHSGLDGWITHCNRLRKKPVDRYQDILSRMEQIR